MEQFEDYLVNAIECTDKVLRESYNNDDIIRAKARKQALEDVYHAFKSIF